MSSKSPPSIARHGVPVKRQNIGEKSTSDIGTILVVDDEVVVRSPVAVYLRDCGYHVVEAANASEAMLVLRQPHLHIDIVIAAAKLSGPLNGFGLAQWVRSSRPEVDVILVGSPERAVSVAGELCERGPMLEKPYDPNAVVQHIRRLLMARRSGEKAPRARKSGE